MTEQLNFNRPPWQIDTSNPDLVSPFTEAMRSIMDPEIGLNIIQLGLIRDVQVAPDSATVRMILTTPYCPYGPAMIETTRQKAEEVFNIPTRVDFIVDEMWDFSYMEDGLASEWGF
jgi:metal-sulfur cluster biosynthetic enzyme